MQRMIFFLATALAVASFCEAPASAADGDTIKAVRARGVLACGVSTGTTVGFSFLDNAGKWNGLDADTCRAVAIAVFGDATKIKFVPTTAQDRFTLLQSGEVDLLSRGTTWTFTRDVQLGIEWAGVNIYGGQTFLVRKSLGVKTIKDLSGATICVAPGSTTELNLADYFRSNNLKYTSVVATTEEQNWKALEAGRCDAYTSDRVTLGPIRTVMGKPDEFEVLGEVISKEPLGPLVRHGDSQWVDVVRWTLNALLVAEELGVSSKNVDEMKAKSNDPEIQRLLGKTGEFGKLLNTVDNEWAARIIKSLGNYGEIYDRHLGANSNIKLPRGINELWTKGGLMYAPPFR